MCDYMCVLQLCLAHKGPVTTVYVCVYMYVYVCLYVLQLCLAHKGPVIRVYVSICLYICVSICVCYSYAWPTKAL